MTNEQQVSSIGLSRRLRELGVKQESLFYWTNMRYSAEKEEWEWVNDDFVQLVYVEDNPYLLPEMPKGARNKWMKGKCFVCSAFTVAELGNMLPIGFSSFRVNPMWRGFKIGNEWCCDDGNQKLHEEYGDTEANVRCKMLIYLLENNLITVEEISKRLTC